MDAVSLQVFGSAFNSFPLLPEIRSDFSTDQLIHPLNEAFRIGYGVIVEPASRIEIQLQMFERTSVDRSRTEGEPD